MIAFCLIATGGERYTKYLDPLLRSIRKFMPENQVVLFTDNQWTQWTQDEAYLVRATTLIQQPNLGWPRATLMRYHAMLKQAELLKQFSHVFYLDVDMLVTSKIEAADICADGITATLHPGYVTTFERNPKSAAYVEGDNHNYYQGCFVGGSTPAFLQMCETITKAIDFDDRCGIMAVYHDESHLNRYLVDHPPAKILSPAYCFPGPAHIRHPERWLPSGVDLKTFVPKIRHLEKLDQASWKK